jgi:hypothetical protein
MQSGCSRDATATKGRRQRNCDLGLHAMPCEVRTQTWQPTFNDAVGWRSVPGLGTSATFTEVASPDRGTVAYLMETISAKGSGVARMS